MQMSENKYVRLCKNFYDKGILVREDEVFDKISPDREWYQSTYYYNNLQFEQFKKIGSVAGVSDVTTNKIWFDFDDESTPENAKRDALDLVERLKNHGIKEANIEAYFTGSKGFHVQVSLKRILNPKQVGNICAQLGKGLATLDLSLYDYAQILRIPGTKHQKTGKYKIPLTISQLKGMDVTDMKKLASSLDNVKDDFQWEADDIPDSLISKEEKKEVTAITSKVDLTNKPKEWRDYKWALLNAVEVKPEERHTALMRIAATCRGLGYPREYAKALCLVFDEKFQANTGKEAVSDLDKNILGSVYNATWTGGQFSYKNDLWLQQYCERIGITPAEANKSASTISITEAFGPFKDFATNIDELTVKTGIPSLDAKVRMTIGMSVGVLAAPAVGKTTLALQILNSMSNSDQQAIFFSYDMYHSLVFQKLVQRHLRVSETEIFEKFKKNDKDFQKKIMDILEKEYKHVEFCFEPGQTPSDIKETIARVEEKTGRKVRLVVVDYNELVMSDRNDATAASNDVAQSLRAIANTLNVCVIVLLQPNKHSGSPSDELTSYRNIKGGSGNEQALSIILGMSRPGFSPRTPEDD